MQFFSFFMQLKYSEVSLKGQISRLPGKPCWPYTFIVLQQHSPLLIKFYPSENWLSSRFSDHSRTGISILTWAADLKLLHF